jgi:glycosyltransferase involved in cell wall biosynthesis
MKIALFHYHLKPGGVSTVIRQQAEALAGQAQTLFLTGAEPERPAPVPTRVIPAIGYDGPGQPAADIDQNPEQSAEQVLRAIAGTWRDGCDLLHVHNPLLAKNRRFLDILSCLQQKGVRLLLQIHDFAEDGRPGAYHRHTGYPKNCHYCVINSRDERYLIEAGLDPLGLHLLPNAVNPFDTVPSSSAAPRFILYPIRAIRRKNIGEAILLSLFFPSSLRLAVTLAPNSRKDLAAYGSWRSFCDRQNLPVFFEASRAYDFAGLVGAAEAVITTSITEGFGFTFLEPWTAGKWLCGRRLPDICRDFEEKGVHLDHLYDRLLVPLSPADKERFRALWQSTFQKSASRYGISLQIEAISRDFESLFQEDRVDFGLLDENLQQRVVRQAAASDRLRQDIIEANPAVSSVAGKPPGVGERISGNRTAVLASYNLDVYRQRLMSIYTSVINQSVIHAVDKTRLALCFLRPRVFSLLKWSDADPD